MGPAAVTAAEAAGGTTMPPVRLGAAGAAPAPSPFRLARARLPRPPPEDVPSRYAMSSLAEGSGTGATPSGDPRMLDGSLMRPEERGDDRGVWRREESRGTHAGEQGCVCPPRAGV